MLHVYTEVLNQCLIHTKAEAQMFRILHKLRSSLNEGHTWRKRICLKIETHLVKAFSTENKKARITESSFRFAVNLVQFCVEKRRDQY